MQMITNQILRAYRQQFDSLQDLTCASLSGFERAQQSTLAMCRQAMGRQLDVAGRITEQATQVALDPDQARPAVEGIMNAQRELLSAVADTQRRCLTAMSGQGGAEQDADLADSYAEAVRESVDQWQRWMAQMFQVTREHADQLSQQARQQGEPMQQAVGSATRTAEQAQEGVRRGAEAAAASVQQSGQSGQSPRRSETHNPRSRVIESA